jgi:initiation factor 1A
LNVKQHNTKSVSNNKFAKMVKNTTGGTGTKSLARKHQSGGDTKLRLPSEALEQIACVTKMLGNGMCEIYTAANVRLICHIPGKFRGKNKRNNLLTNTSVVLIGLRDWERPAKNCDLLTIYEESHINQLKNIPNINMNNIMKLRNASVMDGKEDTSNDVEFGYVDEKEEEKVLASVGKTKEVFTLENTMEVDIDDI